MGRHTKITTRRRNYEPEYGRHYNSAEKQRRSAKAERERKTKISKAVEVPRGLRAGTLHERNRLEYASPRLRAQAIRETGSAMRPRIGRTGLKALSGAPALSQLGAARNAAGGFRLARTKSAGTYRTFTGKRMRAADPAGKRDAKLTAVGKWFKAKYGS